MNRLSQIYLVDFVKMMYIVIAFETSGFLINFGNLITNTTKGLYFNILNFVDKKIDQ